MLVVFGSINMDVNLTVGHFPEMGETVLSSSYAMTPGGKGANQALAAARMEAKTALVGKVGDDGNGLRVINNLKRNGVMTSGIAKSEDYPTGLAMVAKTKKGDNRIIVASGANLMVSADQCPPDILHANNILLVQMELPLEQNALVMKAAKDTGAPVILNMAPSLPVPVSFFSLVDYLIVNEVEAKQVAKILSLDTAQSDDDLCKAIAQKAKLTTIMTKGAKGVVLSQKDGKGLTVPALPLEEVVDTTGAGDCFCGTFSACLHDKKSLEDSVRTAVVAASLSCQQKGTQDSYPYYSDIEECLEKLGAIKLL